MDFKKFISGVSAMAIAASAVAGLAVTASAESVVNVPVFTEDFESTTDDNVKDAWLPPTDSNWDTTGQSSLVALRNNVAANTTKFVTVHGDNLSRSTGAYYYLTNAVTGKATVQADLNMNVGSNSGSSYVYFMPTAETAKTGSAVPTSYLFALKVTSTGLDLTNGTDTLTFTNVTSNSKLTAANGNLAQLIASKGYASVGWFNVSAELDYDSHQAKVTVTKDGTAEAQTIDFKDTTATGFVGFRVMTGTKYLGAVGFDNILITQPKTVYTTTINVTDASGAGMSGAKVTFNDAAETVAEETSNAGEYVASLPAGDYSYSVVCAGYAKIEKDLTVVDDTTSDTVVLKNGVDVTITTLPGAEVSVEDNGTVTADSDGNATFTLADGTYSVTTVADGYFDKTSELVVENGAATSGAAIELTALYNVTYSVDSEKGTVSGSTNVVVNKTDSKPATAPTVTATNDVDGYVFLGWSSDGSTIVDPTAVAVSDNTTYTALFSDQIKSKTEQSPTADTYVAWDDLETDHSKSEILNVNNKKGTAIAANRYGSATALKFDLSDKDLSNVVYAKLVLSVVGYDNANSSERTVSAYTTSNTDWSDTMLGADFYSAIGAETEIGSSTFAPNSGQATVVIPLTVSTLKSAVDADSLVSIALHQSAGRYISFASNESTTAAAPQLVLYYNKEQEKTLPIVKVEKISESTDFTTDKAARAYTGTFTVTTDNYAVSGVKWTASIGDVKGEDTVNFKGSISSGTTVVTGLTIQLKDADSFTNEDGKDIITVKAETIAADAE
jgi:hypothetical protein